MTKECNLPAEVTHPQGGENLEAMKEAKNYNRFLSGLIRRFALDTKEVLDFGAGIGTFTGSLDVPPDRMVCVETDTEAQASLVAEGYEVYTDLADIADARFTYIFTLNVLEHIEDDGKVIAELYRVLQPGGRIFVYVPAFNLLYTSMDAHVGHYRRYRMEGMTDLLETAGFNVEKRAYTDALGFFATLVYKILDNNSDGALDKAVIRFYDRYFFPVSRVISLLLARVLGKNLYVVASRSN